MDNRANVELAQLISAGGYRDGGSYGASFETDDDRIYSIWLQRSKMPDAEGRHHRWLFVYFGENRPDNILPVVTGSPEERELLAGLNGFLASAEGEFPATAEVSADSLLVRLRELIRYIERREPCFPHDLAGWRRA